MSILFSACTRPASRTVLETSRPTAPTAWVSIQSVTVTAGQGIYVRGESHLPAGECVQTDLQINGDTAQWWPRDVCIQPDGGLWELLVALGKNGAPDQLAADSHCTLRAWWPGQPQTVQANFPFTLQPISVP